MKQHSGPHQGAGSIPLALDVVEARTRSRCCCCLKDDRTAPGPSAPIRVWFVALARRSLSASSAACAGECAESGCAGAAFSGSGPAERLLCWESDSPDGDPVAGKLSGAVEASCAVMLPRTVPSWVGRAWRDGAGGAKDTGTELSSSSEPRASTASNPFSDSCKAAKQACSRCSGGSSAGRSGPVAQVGGACGILFSPSPDPAGPGSGSGCA